MNVDLELESWKRQWREPGGETLPDFRAKIRRQDRRTMLVLMLGAVCLVGSLVAVWQVRTAFWSGLAAGLWFSTAVMGAYVWRVRRGTWRPAARTTQAYIELCYRRAIAKERIARFAGVFLGIAVVAYGIFVLWNHEHISPLSVVVLAALAAESFFLRAVARRKRREIEATGKFLQSSAESQIKNTE